MYACQRPRGCSSASLCALFCLWGRARRESTQLYNALQGPPEQLYGLQGDSSKRVARVLQPKVIEIARHQQMLRHVSCPLQRRPPQLLLQTHTTALPFNQASNINRSSFQAAPKDDSWGRIKNKDLGAEPQKASPGSTVNTC